jgi:hypothetical protein
MALRDDVEAGLAALSVDRPEALSLDAEGACEITMRIPPAILKLAGGKMAVRVKVARTGRFFTLLAPIAASSRDLPAEVARTMLADQFFADQVGGASFALNVETGVVFASHHWMIESITAPQFTELFRKFTAAAFLLLERMGTIAGQVRGIATIQDAEIK